MEQPTVVIIDRWPFYTSGHRDRLHCTFHIIYYIVASSYCCLEFHSQHTVKLL